MRFGANLQSLSPIRSRDFKDFTVINPSTAILECSADNKEKKDGAVIPKYNFASNFLLAEKISVKVASMPELQMEKT